MTEIDNSMLAELEQESRLMRARNARLEAEVTVLTEMVRVLSDKLAQVEAKQEQGEPVAWLVEFENGEQELHFDEQAVGEVQIPLYTTTILPAYKPVAWMDADGNVSDNNDHKCFPIPLYTTPQQRTWVGLTSEDYNEIFEKARTGEHAVQLAEARLKDLNT